MGEGTSVIQLSLPLAGLARLQQMTTKQVMRKDARSQSVCRLYLLDCPAKCLLGFFAITFRVILAHRLQYFPQHHGSLGTPQDVAVFACIFGLTHRGNAMFLK